MSEPWAVATRREGFAHGVAIGSHSLISDEPASVGGTDEGPSPTRLLAASLAACTAITVEMYADRKGWELPHLEVAVDVEGDPTKGDATWLVTLHLPGGLSEEQTQRITTIAARCPVHRALVSETEVRTTSRIGA
jgi:putative redox protein